MWIKEPGANAIWSYAQYFNPVDMVCCTKNYRGEKFNLDCTSIKMLI